MTLRILTLALLLWAGISSATADTWPSKPIKMIVAAPAGSSLDLIARVISDPLKQRLKQPIIVENIPGASGTIATAQAARAAADGYTILVSFNGPLAFSQFLTKLPYDPQQDLKPVILTSSQPNILAVHANIPAENIKDVIEYARTHPGKLNYASVGNGSSSHLTMELFKRETGIDILHIPYNGAPPAALSLATGDTQLLFAVPSPLQPHLKSGKIKALAVTSTTRFSLFPDIPTVAESGFPNVESIAWNGILIPAGTPETIIERLNREINVILKDPNIKSKFNSAGLETAGGSSNEFRQLIRTEASKWSKIIHEAKIQSE